MDSDNDDMMFDDTDSDLETEESGKSDQDYQILDPTALEAQMMEAISNVQEVFKLTPGVARILLHKFKWNKDLLLEKFYENPDTQAFLIEHQVIPKAPAPGSEAPPTPEDEEAECDICCDLTKLSGLSCGHKACSECWKMYLTDKVKEGQSEIQCMASDCKLLMEDEKIKDYISEESFLQKHRQLVINSYVENNSLLSWCPGTDCGRAIQVRYSESRLVVCSCGTRFCFQCGNDSHKPASCRLLRLWKKKSQELRDKQHTTDGYGADNDSFAWLMANTRDCPKCMVPIEKNGGCNYMQCRNALCRYQFCWVCMKDWKVHAQAWYNCNAYEPDAEASREKKRADLHRLVFYYTRYVAHERSLELEGKLRQKVELKMAQMEQRSQRWIDVQYLQQAVDTLQMCRNTLMFTYVFAYYLKRDNNSLLFEANQKDLEMSTEKLSAFLERDIKLDEQDLKALRQSVMDKCRYVEHRRQILLDHCAEGDEQEIWEYNE